MANARQATVTLIYNGADISEDVSKHLINFTFTDNEGGKADDLTVTLEDREGKWRGDWLPAKGATLVATINMFDWDAPGQVLTYPCGTFEIDQIDLNGGSSGSTVSIKAASARMSKSVRQEGHTRAWENVKLSDIAGDIASSNGLALVWDSSEDFDILRRDQVEQSDIAFITELCGEYGIMIKVVDDQLVCYSVEDYEAKGSVGEIKFEEVVSYRFSTKTNHVHQKSQVSYHDSVADDDYQGEAEEEDLEA